MFKAVIMKEQSNLDKKYTVNRRGQRVVGSFGERNVRSEGTENLSG